MAFDRISEEIAHFIGLFHLEIEGNRLRLEYEAFSINSREVDRAFQGPPDLVVASPHALKGFDPGLVYLRPPIAPPPPLLLAGDPPFSTLQVNSPQSAPPELPDIKLNALGGWQVGGVFVPQPNSILVKIQQTAIMSDDDVLLVTGSTVFVDPSLLMSELQDLILTAQSLEAPAITGNENLPSVPLMMELASEITLFTPPDMPVDVQLLLTGEFAQGMYLNGEDLSPVAAADTPQHIETLPEPQTEVAPAEDPKLPEFKDVLPAYLSEKWDMADEPATSEKDAFALPVDPALHLPIDLMDVEPGHKVVTGGNVLINEVAIHQAWVDAPVIAVAGDAIRLDTVSQVNLRKETPAPAWPEATMSPSTALNAISITLESSEPPLQETPQSSKGQLPQAWNIVHVEGDLVAVNWIQQHIFATDFDRAEITISAAATFISTGENVITNVVQLKEFGFHYDLILIGGNMITLNQIHQVNVLLDDDQIKGAAEADHQFSTGDNLQYNLVEIKQTGRDEMVAMKDSFQKSLDDMAKGKRDIATDVLQDSRFEGKSALKVLQIDGDMVKANVIEQKNYLGDSDQIKLMLEGILAAGDGIELITGSNAQLNSVRLVDMGLDSEVMVAGTAYSDALIYQAQLLDDDAPPDGVLLAPLANEAIAFLADDMIGSKPEIIEHAQFTGDDHPASSDVLLAMTA